MAAKRRGRSYPAVAAGLALAGLAVVGLVGHLPPSAGTEITIIAYILNAQPEVRAITLLDDRGAPCDAVDPGTGFTIEVECRDNNTAGDIAKITVVLYSPQSQEESGDSPSDHYTLTWTAAAGFHGTALVSSGCAVPENLEAATAKWRFCLLLDRVARAGEGWKASVTVEDENESAKQIRSFAVNKYVLLRMGTEAMSLRGAPGSRVVAPVTIFYEANHVIELGCRSSPFVGKLDPSFRLEPSRFQIDDDPSTELPESGVSILVLSDARQSFIGGLTGSNQLTIYVFVDIPQPFLDQDYEGSLVFDARSG